jgi:hypothetical protein
MKGRRRGGRCILSRVRTTHQLPDVRALKCFHPLDTSLTPGTALRHALNYFQRMEVIGVHSAIGTAHNFLNLGAVRHVHRGHSPCNRQRRTGHERKIQFLGQCNHFLGPVESPAEVLVRKDWRGRTDRFEAVSTRLEEAVPRVHCLVVFVLWVIAVPTGHRSDHVVSQQK